MKKLIFTFLLLAFISSPLQAEEDKGLIKGSLDKVSEYSENTKEYAGDMKDKFWFGLKNILVGWTEIFKKPYEYAKDDKNVIEGVFAGLVQGVSTTVGGAANVATSPLTKVEVPIPMLTDDAMMSHRRGYVYSDSSHPDYIEKDY